LRLRPSAFATFLVWRLRIGACGVGACGFGAYDSYPISTELKTQTKILLLRHTSACRGLLLYHADSDSGSGFKTTGKTAEMHSQPSVTESQQKRQIIP